MRDAFTFDDLLIVPSYSEVVPKQATLQTRLTKNIMLQIPLLSSAMDTVTESKMAIAMAQLGGLGVIHRNLSIQDQVKEVQIVKRAANGVVHKPAVLSPNATIRQAKEQMKLLSVSGFPVTQDATMNTTLLGIVTNRDLHSATDDTQLITTVMTTNLVTAEATISLETARKIMTKNKIEKLPLLNSAKQLQGLVCMKDIVEGISYPKASRDFHGRLMVAAAVGAGKQELERARQLDLADVDMFLIDSAHGHHKLVGDMVVMLKDLYPKIPVIAGNIATPEGAQFLANAGADAIKVGIGPGSICTTRMISGVGVPQATAILDAIKVVGGPQGIPIIADGGIKYSGDIAKAIALGADAVMIGSLFAGAQEAPGEILLWKGRSYKSYRGMGSLSAMKTGFKNRYLQDEVDNAKLVPEGIEAAVPLSGSLSDVVSQLLGGVQATMGYCGAANLDQLRERAKFVRISGASLQESHVHDVTIIKEAPNYKR